MKTEILTIAFDLDSTLCDLLEAWLKAYNEKFDDNLKPEDIADWNIKKFVKDEAKKEIFKIINSEGFYKNVKPIEELVEKAKSLHEQGHKLAICTSCANNTVMIKGKIDWLKKHTPFISRENFMFVNNKGLLRADILYDDKPENILDFLEGNKESVGVLISQHHNQKWIKAYSRTEYLGDRLVIWELDV